jgi:hypothetical protein
MIVKKDERPKMNYYNIYCKLPDVTFQYRRRNIDENVK